MSKTVRSMNGRILRAVVGAAALGVLLTGCIGFTVEKEVEGDPRGDDAGPYVVRIECTGTDPDFAELQFFGEQTRFVQFEADGGVTEVTCTVEETDDNDADEVTIECVDPLPPDVTCTESDDEITVTITAITTGTDIDINVKVTNEFDPPTTTTSTTTSHGTTGDGTGRSRGRGLADLHRLSSWASSSATYARRTSRSRRT